MDKSSPKSKWFEDFLENTYFKVSQHYYKLTTRVDEEKELNNYILFLESSTEINTSFEEKVSARQYVSLVGIDNLILTPL